MLEHAGLRENPAQWQEFYGDRPLWVFTHRDLPVIPDADIRFTDADVAAVHAEMARAAGDRNIWLIGGGDLAGQFADRGLLDEIILGIAPVTLGAGAPVLPRRIDQRLRLLEAQQSRDFAYVTYAVDPPTGAGS